MVKPFLEAGDSIQSGLQQQPDTKKPFSVNDFPPLNLYDDCVRYLNGEKLSPQLYIPVSLRAGLQPVEEFDTQTDRLQPLRLPMGLPKGTQVAVVSRVDGLAQVYILTEMVRREKGTQYDATVHKILSAGYNIKSDVIQNAEQVILATDLHAMYPELKLPTP